MKKSVIRLLVIFLFQVSFLLSFQNNEFQVFFSPEDHCDKQLIAIINNAHKNIDIAIYSLTRENIVQAIVSANQRGVKVRVITDYQQALNKNSKDEYLIKNKVAIITDKHPGYMHNKFAVVDNKIVVTGSYNWTNNATNINDENMLVIYSESLSKIYTKRFEKIWKDNE
jgi:phosphatidylserine/phosphatidylglycerophosphate/cardiolipin synthase-like enzyme